VLKAILVIADGMADWPLKELDGRTPLDVAAKPTMNRIARDGVCGIVDPISPGTPPGSDTATIAFLGYSPMEVYSGRGALEAVGSGVEVLRGDVAFRCNFASVDKDLVVLDRRSGRISNEDASRLTRSLQRIKLKKSFDASFVFKNTVQHRATLVIRGPKLSTTISDSDPEQNGKKVLEIGPLDRRPESVHTAAIVSRLMSEFRNVLAEHPVNKERARRKQSPANFVLCRGAGTIPKIIPLPELYNIKSACIAAVSLIRGVCKVAGMDLISVKGATGTPQTDYMAKAKAAVKALKTHDFVLLHVKATDVASHDGNARLKVETIGKIDGMLDHVLKNIDFDATYLALTADHTTSCVTRNHEGDPVPIAIVGPYVRRDSVREYSERACAEGGLNRIRGTDLMRILMSFLGRTKKFGS
jgi:2,3-bisphosphoglycerate-independent phosphoglycerate mutase